LPEDKSEKFFPGFSLTVRWVHDLSAERGARDQANPGAVTGVSLLRAST
jgi:hypothetical protein